MKERQLLILFACVLMTGCVGLQFQQRDVLFENQLPRLDIQPVEPNAAEKAGVVLRFNPPVSGVRTSQEEIVVYTQVKDNRGSELRLVQNLTEHFKPGSRKDSYIDLGRTTFENASGELIEDLEVTTRGEIVRFIRGFHDSKMGKFTIVDWKRTPTVPEGPVKIGDTWNYEETMDLRLESKLAREIDPKPFTIKAQCSLSGFAEMKGNRVAVVKIATSQKRLQRLKVLFKEVTMVMKMHVEETDYIDYAEGVVLAKIAWTRSTSDEWNYDIHDEELGQSVFFVK